VELTLAAVSLRPTHGKLLAVARMPAVVDRYGPLRPTHGKLLAVARMPAVVDRYGPLFMGSMSVAW
jgi:hypothetical protein